MVMEFTNGKMDEDMLAAMNLIKKADMANTTGMMEGFLKECGIMAKEMEKGE